MSIQPTAQTFKTSFLQLLTFCEKILGTKSSGPKYLAALTKYKVIYNKDPSLPGHLHRMQKVYEECKPFLEKGELDDFMVWMNEKPWIVVEPTKDSKAKIYLTVAFRRSCQIAKDLDKKASEAASPEEKEKILDKPGLVYPEQFVLHLLRVFMFCANENDQTKFLEPLITELEENLGLSKGEASEFVSDDFGGIFSQIGNFTKQMGLDMGNQMPNEKQMKDLLNQFNTNPEAQGTFKDVLGSLDFNNPETITNSITKIMDRMKQPTVPEPVQKSLAYGKN